MTSTHAGASRAIAHAHASRHRRTPIVAAAAIALLLAPAAMARGGGGHGFGHIGHSGGFGGGGGGAIITPSYVLISTTAVSNKDAFTAAMHGLPDTVLAFAGRIISDGDNPPAWEGTAAAHATMIQFDSTEAARRWKDSDAYKAFDAQLKTSSTSAISEFIGVPTASPMAMAAGMHSGHGRGRGGMDPKAFEPIVKEYDATLSRMQSICRGC